MRVCKRCNDPITGRGSRAELCQECLYPYQSKHGRQMEAGNQWHSLPSTVIKCQHNPAKQDAIFFSETAYNERYHYDYEIAYQYCPECYQALCDEEMGNQLFKPFKAGLELVQAESGLNVVSGLENHWSSGGRAYIGFVVR